MTATQNKSSNIPDQYVEHAYKVIDSLNKNYKGEFELTTTQLRNLLSLTAQIYDEAQLLVNEELPAELKAKVQYLMVRFIYQAGREKSVKDLLDKSSLLPALKEANTSRSELIRFCRYMESLVAWKKYLDPKEK